MTVGACPSRPLVAKEIEGLVRQQVAEVARRLDEKGRKQGSTVDAAVARHTGRRIAELKERRQELRRKLDERDRSITRLNTIDRYPLSKPQLHVLNLLSTSQVAK